MLFFSLNAMAQDCGILIQRSKLLTETLEVDYAMQLAQEAVQCFDATDSISWMGRVDAYFQIAWVWYVKGDTYKAIQFSDTARQLYKSRFDTLNNHYLKHLFNAGIYQNTVGQFENAYATFNGIIHSYHLMNLDSCEEWYYAKLNVVQVMSAQGYYETANTITKELTELYLTKYSRADTFYFYFINELGISYHKLGQYEKAIATYEKYMDEPSDTTHYYIKEYRDIVNNIAYFYNIIGDVDKAISINENLLQYKRIYIAEKPLDYAWTLNHLGNFYGRKQQFQKAEEYLLEAARIRQSIAGTKNLWFAFSENNLGMLYSDLGKYTIALDYQSALLNRSIDNPVFERQFVATFMHNYGTTFYRIKNYDSALLYYHKALNLRKEVFGIHHISYLETLDAIIRAYIENGDDATAIKYAAENIKLIKDYLISSLTIYTEAERNKLIRKFSTAGDVYYSLLQRQTDKRRGEWAIGYSVFMKSLSLNELARVLKTAFESKDSSVQALKVRWISLRSYISKQYTQPLNAQSKYLQDSVSKLTALERQLSTISSSFRNYVSSSEFELPNFRDQLANEQAIIECISFRYFSRNGLTDSTLYAAIILTEKDSIPHWVYLFEEKQLKNLLFTVHPNLLYSNSKILSSKQQQYGDKLYNLIWEKIAPQLEGINTVYYSPSGILNQVALAAIPFAATSKTISSKYKLVQMGSTKNIVVQEPTMLLNDIALMGGIQYNADSISFAANITDSGLGNANIYTTTIMRSTDKPTKSFQYLPSTLTEVDSITATSTAATIVTNVYTGKNATEEVFKKMDGNSPSVLHIATHGFYLPHKNKKNTEDPNQTNFSLIEDPMLRSGIALAGANLKWNKNIDVPNCEDGIVTAYEIAQMDLSKTELAVLSACESGLGDIDGSEGVFGLQRGFKSAGVRKLILTLWQVPDKATMEFMTLFYSKWLKEKKDIHTSFADTQKTMTEKYKAEPYKWAGFVLVE